MIRLGCWLRTARWLLCAGALTIAPEVAAQSPHSAEGTQSWEPPESPFADHGVASQVSDESDGLPISQQSDDSASSASAESDAAEEANAEADSEADDEAEVDEERSEAKSSSKRKAIKDEPTQAAPSRGPKRLFFTGTSAGKPSAGKLITLYTLYVGAVGSLAVGGIGLAQYFDRRASTDEFLDGYGDPGPCYDLADSDCEHLDELRAKENSSASLVGIGAAGAGLFLVSGLLIAEEWDNVRPQVAVSAEGVSFHVRIAF